MKTLLPLSSLTKKQLTFTLAAVISCSFLGAMFFTVYDKNSPPVENALRVRTTTIQKEGKLTADTYSGEVCGRYEKQLSFQVSGKIIKRQVDLGSLVQAGDILMQIDAKDIQQNLNNNAAQVAAAESQVSLAKSNLNRYRQLLEQSAISQAQYDQYVNAYNVALAGMQQATAQKEQGTHQFDYSFLRADTVGVVTRIAAEAGQVVSSGQIVVTVVEDGEREIEIHVPESRIGELYKPEQIKISFWALPGLTVDGTIREIAPMADPHTRTFKVRISLINPPPETKLGMTASVCIAPLAETQAMHIPLTAVYQEGSSPAVWLVKDDIVSLQPIIVGKFSTDTVEVLSGLSQGDCIVTAGVHKLQSGQKVQIGGDSL